jgi:hypothetical protein
VKLSFNNEGKLEIRFQDEKNCSGLGVTEINTHDFSALRLKSQRMTEIMTTPQLQKGTLFYLFILSNFSLSKTFWKLFSREKILWKF